MKLINRLGIAGAVLASGTLVATGVAMTAASPAAPEAQAAQADLAGSHSSSGFGTHEHRGLTVETVRLRSMPQGTVRFDLLEGGRLSATVNMFGLTPGSSHTVWIVTPDGKTLVTLGTLTADGTGQANATLNRGQVWRIPTGSRLVIGLDTASGQPIARTNEIWPGEMGYQLTAVEVGPTGIEYGTPQGRATVAYNPAAQTITVTLTASGLTPGAHAAHIHVGSCQSQGPVQYMLMDFMANAQGQVVHQVRTVTGVTSPIPAGAWYLNLHQGNSNNILANGQPTVNFRPLLCAGL